VVCGGPRPDAGPGLDVDADLAELRRLLSIQRGRLDVALRIEDERSIVFPETSVIIRDVERLLDLIAEHEGRSRKHLREAREERRSKKRARRSWSQEP
jgi:hypothetical protein